MSTLRSAFALVAIMILAVSAPARSAQPQIGVALADVRAGAAREASAEDPEQQPARSSGSDEPDGVSGPQTHVIYFVPKGVPDRLIDTDGTISRSIGSMLDWFRLQMNKRPRMDRLQNSTALDTTFVAGSEEAGYYSSLRVISNELRTKGFNHPAKRYIVYAAIDRGNVCGEGSYPLPGVDYSGRFAALYINSSASCGSSDFGGGSATNAGKAETTIVQEWLHTEGLVSPASPHHCATAAFHVCTGPLWLTPDLDPEAADALFPLVTGKLSAKVLDRGRDDYLDHPFHGVLPDLRDSAWLE